ncbi:calcium/sodium antiporter [Paenibacillus sp.]|uniref:calcium/sodium antiporter n=1 Tax=Paenibacillus sp. TaxID=58172 RepID=UPI002D46BC47|nr:calcium/sodium antiporter [Paenibacillus sp.]HZG55260.1 calcium/sodium antiporter [Paenibacillus sp.]
MSYILLLVGFGLLIAGANYFVEGASSIAARLRVSPMLIGLTIVAFGTSSPEATVSIIAALQHNAGVSLGNVIGSNVFNTALVTGLVAVIAAIQVRSETIRKEIPFTLLASTALLVLVGDLALQGAATSWITRGDGLILLLFFSVFLYYLFEAARNGKGTDAAVGQTERKAPASWAKLIFFTAAGLGAIIYGGHLVVLHATAIALRLGMSETLAGLTIVAVGTSLPELVTSVAAAVKKQNDIAIGNIVGSNIFNILFVLGVSAVISPLPVAGPMLVDIAVLIALTGLLFVVSRTHYRVGRIEGTALVLAYAAYMVYVVMRG